MKTAAAWAAWSFALSGAAPRGISMALEKTGSNRIEGLLNAIEGSDPDAVEKIYRKMLSDGADPWQVHRSVYPAVQPVLNPPFINPHLPKMYALYRELAAYLEPEDLPSLVGLELREYARRPKLEKHSRPEIPGTQVSFRDMTTAFRVGNRETAFNLMAAFHSQAGGAELARSLLLVGGGHLDASLGHSLSCTAFMVREVLERENEDPSPALFALAHYFCEGRFHISPSPVGNAASATEHATDHMTRATSGRGIVNLHHTITFYALDRMRHLFTPEEYRYLYAAVVRFMGEKESGRHASDLDPKSPPGDYAEFFNIFSSMDTGSVMSSVWRMTSSGSRRRELGRYLVKGVCDLYQGNYNPHFLTGLGSLLWVLEKYPGEEQVCRNALSQYLDYYFRGL